MKRLSVAIDIDGVVAGGKYDEWDWSKEETYADIPVMFNAREAMWKLAKQKRIDAYYCTGRPRNLSVVTNLWMDEQEMPALPIYYCDWQAKKPAFLNLLEANVVIDDNPNVLYDLDRMWKQDRTPTLICVNNPEFHCWQDKFDFGRLYDLGIKVVKDLGEAVAVVERLVRP